VRADRSALGEPLADAVAGWLATGWPWLRVDRCSRLVVVAANWSNTLLSQMSICEPRGSSSN
jgi:hypothetical protein